MNASPKYTLRVSVKTLDKDPIFGLGTESTFDVGGIHVKVKQREHWLTLSAGDFSTETEAEAFLPRIKGGLWNLAIEHNIAFIPFFQRQKIFRPPDPQIAASNLARSLGVAAEEPVQPLHGITDEEGYIIFHSDENLRFVSIGDATMHVSIGWPNVERALVAGIEQIRQHAEDGNDDLTQQPLICICRASRKAPRGHASLH